MIAHNLYSQGKLCCVALSTIKLIHGEMITLPLTTNEVTDHTVHYTRCVFETRESSKQVMQVAGSLN